MKLISCLDIPLFVVSRKTSLVSYSFKFFAKTGVPVTIRPVICPLFCDIPNPYTGTHAGGSKPSTLFIRPVGNNKITFQLNIILNENPKHLYAAGNSQNSVKPSAGLLRIKMRPGHYCTKFSVFSGFYCKHISHFINSYFTSTFSKPFHQQFAAFSILIGRCTSLKASVSSSTYFCGCLNCLNQSLCINSYII